MKQPLQGVGAQQNAFLQQDTSGIQATMDKRVSFMCVDPSASICLQAHMQDGQVAEDKTQSLATMLLGELGCLSSAAASRLVAEAVGW